jgi:long-chain acyl-CoA synthetase
VANTLQIFEWMLDVKMGQETILMATPLFHIYGMIAGMSLGIYSASTLVMFEDPGDETVVIRSINKYKPTIFLAIPTMYDAIINDSDVKAGKVDVRSIWGWISGSVPLLQETKLEFEKLTGGRLVEGYGLSEALAITHCNPFCDQTRTGSIGLPLPDVDARIVDQENGVTVLPPGNSGELVIKSPNVMVGYHNNPNETANSLRNGWLYTGDIARMDEDGFFYIIDRKNELITSGGFQVWPREVEGAIVENPKVQEVSVAGIPDPYRGERVKAWIVLKPGQTAEAEEIRVWCKDRLAPFKVPTHIEFKDALPKTTLGEILRRELVKQHLEAERG